MIISAPGTSRKGIPRADTIGTSRAEGDVRGEVRDLNTGVRNTSFAKMQTPLGSQRRRDGRRVPTVGELQIGIRTKSPRMGGSHTDDIGPEYQT